VFVRAGGAGFLPKARPSLSALMRSSPDQDCLLYGKTAGGGYRALRVTDGGAAEHPSGMSELLGAEYQYWSGNIQPNGAWFEANDPAKNATELIGAPPVVGSYNGLQTLDFVSAFGRGCLATARIQQTIPITSAIVCNVRTVGSNNVLWQGYDQGAPGVVLRNYANVPTSVLLGSDSVLDCPGIVTVNAPQIIVTVYDGPNSHCQSGAVKVSGPASEAYTSGNLLAFGNSRELALAALNAWIGDFFIWDRVLQQHEINRVVDYLKDRWGIV